jgi:hypothetical protein
MSTSKKLKINDKINLKALFHHYGLYNRCDVIIKENIKDLLVLSYYLTGKSLSDVLKNNKYKP